MQLTKRLLAVEVKRQLWLRFRPVAAVRKIHAVAHLVTLIGTNTTDI